MAQKLEELSLDVGIISPLGVKSQQRSHDIQIEAKGVIHESRLVEKMEELRGDLEAEESQHAKAHGGMKVSISELRTAAYDLDKELGVLHDEVAIELRGIRPPVDTI